MADLVPITEDSLRSAMRDERYWRSGHPERADYHRWVTNGWEAIVRDGARGGGVVHVQAYTRVRDGKTEHVAAHTRSGPPGGDRADRHDARGRDPNIHQVQAQLAVPAARGAQALVQGAQRLAPLALGALRQGLPEIRRRSLLDDDETRPRIGNLAPRTLYTVVPEQPGERELSQEADANGDAENGAESEPRPRYTVHEGQQGKHIRGHNNYDPNRGEISPDVDVQALVDRHAGHGEPVNKFRPGTPSSRERFDTGDQVIGTYRDERTGERVPTTRGIIHYGANGRVHVVPARPRGWTEREPH